LSLLLLALVGGRAPAAGAAQHAFHGFAPSQLIRTYNFDPLYQRGLSGKGQTIAFIEVDGFDQGDLTAFNRTYGLPQVQPSVYLPQGATLQDMPPAEGETTMDLEYAHALAPGARLQVYEVLNAGDFSGYATGLSDALSAAAAHGATVISMSLRATGNLFCSQLHAALQMHATLEQVTARGISVLAASGDYGASPCQTHPLDVGTVYPAADPAVTAVGGTHLTLTRNGAYGSESAWRGSGGGDTSDFTRPAWQHGPGALTSSSREVPDVAFDADPASGVAVRLQGKWQVIGGTSLGAPCWAALWALAAQAHRARTGHAIGWANPLLYGLANSPQRTRVFHDVTTGDNGYYQAGPGWDAVTGWGSPNADALVQALAS
jgi:kumamolisin